MAFVISKSTMVALRLTVNNKTFASGGEVVTSHSGVGVGIRFTGMASQDLSVLKSVLEELATSPIAPPDSSVLEGLTP